MAKKNDIPTWDTTSEVEEMPTWEGTSEVKKKEEAGVSEELPSPEGQEPSRLLGETVKEGVVAGAGYGLAGHIMPEEVPMGEPQERIFELGVEIPKGPPVYPIESEKDYNYRLDEFKEAKSELDSFKGKSEEEQKAFINKKLEEKLPKEMAEQKKAEYEEKGIEYAVEDMEKQLQSSINERAGQLKDFDDNRGVRTKKYISEEEFNAAKAKLDESRQVVQGMYDQLKGEENILQTAYDEARDMPISGLYVIPKSKRLKKKRALEEAMQSLDKIESVLRAQTGEKEGLKAALKYKMLHADDLATLGWSEVADNFQLKGIVDKIEKGKDISEEEMFAIMMYGFKQDVEENFDTTLSYDVASGLADMIPFMAEMIATGGFATATKQSLQQGLKTGTKKGLQMYLKRGLAHLGASGARTFAFHDVYGGAAERQIGRVYVDDEGTIKVEGRQKLPEALAKSYLNTLAEVTVEGFTDEVIGIGKKVAKDPLSKAIRNEAHWNGMVGEFAEEMVTAGLQAPIDGQSLKDVYTPRMIATTAITVAFAHGTIQGTTKVSSRVNANINRKRMMESGDIIPLEIKETIDDLFDKKNKIEEVSAGLDKIVERGKREGWTDGELSNIMEYSQRKASDQGYLGKVFEDVNPEEEVTEEKKTTPEKPAEAEIRPKEVPVEEKVAEEEKVAKIEEKEVEPKKVKDEKEMQREEAKIDEGVREEVAKEKVGEVKPEEEIGKPETVKEAESNIKVLEGEKSSLEKTLEKVPEDQKSKLDQEIQSIDTQIQKQQDYAKELESRPVRQEGEKVRKVEGIRDKDMPEVDWAKLPDRPKEKIEEIKTKIDREIEADIGSERVKELRGKKAELMDSVRDRMARLGGAKFLTGEKGVDPIKEVVGIIKDLGEIGIINLDLGARQAVDKLKKYMAASDPEAIKVIDKNIDQIEQTLKTEIPPPREPGDIPVPADIKQEAEATFKEVKERKLGQKAMESALPEEFKKDLAERGITYATRGRRVNRDEAKEVVRVMEEKGMSGELKAAILDTGNGIKPDTRTTLSVEYVQSQMDKARTETNSNKAGQLRQDAVDVFQSDMFNSTMQAQALEAKKQWNDVLATEPDFVVENLQELYNKWNKDYLEGHDDDIKKVSTYLNNIIKQEGFDPKVKLDQQSLDKIINELLGQTDKIKKKQLAQFVNDYFDVLRKEGKVNKQKFEELYAKALGLAYLTDKQKALALEASEQINNARKIGNQLDKAYQDLIDLLQNKPKADASASVKKAYNEKVSALEDKINQLSKEYSKALVTAQKANGVLGELSAKEKNFSDMFSTFIQGNLLTPISLVTNVVANAMWVPIRSVKNYTATVLDAGLSEVGKVRNRIENRVDATKNPKLARMVRKLPSTERTVKAFNASQGYFQGVAEGTIEGIRQMYTGQLPSDAYTREIAASLKPIRAAVDAYMAMTGKEKAKMSKTILNTLEATFGVAPEIMFRMLNLGDKPFRRAAEKAKLTEIAALKGLKGVEKERFMKFPDEKSAEQAREAGLEATFQQDNVITKAISRVSNWSEQKKYANKLDKQVRGLVKVIMKTQMPYVKTPTNIILETIDYAIPEISIARGLMAMRSGNRKKAVEMFSRAAVGYMITGIASSLLASGIMSLAPGGLEEEEDEGKRKARLSEYRNKPAYYMNMSAFQRYLFGGDPTWQEADDIISYKRFGIISSIMMAQAESFRGKTPEQIAETSFLEKRVGSFLPVIRSSLDQSFLTGLNTGLNALMKGGYEQDAWYVNTARAMSAIAIPNTYASVNKYYDQYIREVKNNTLKGIEKNKDEIKRDFKSRLTTDSGLPTKVTVWGEKVERVPDGKGLGYILFDLTQSKKYNSDFGVKIHELYERTGNTDVLPRETDRYINVKDERVKLTPELYYQRQLLEGRYKKMMAASVVNSQGWDGLTDQGKTIFLVDRTYGSEKWRNTMKRLEEIFLSMNFEEIYRLREKKIAEEEARQKK